jgi:chromosome partitioning protein
LGLLTVNGLVAATEVMVPIQCEYYALEGLAQLTRNVDLVRTNLNPGLEISGIVMVMYDGRTRLAEQVVSEVRGHLPTGSRSRRSIPVLAARLPTASLHER